MIKMCLSVGTPFADMYLIMLTVAIVGNMDAKNRIQMRIKINDLSQITIVCYSFNGEKRQIR